MAKKKEKEAAKTEKKINKTKKKDVGEKLKVIPIGGVDGIGMNMTLLEHGEDLIAVDCGVAFPDEEMPGVDLVIPDISYLEANKDKIRGILLTHGHFDHLLGVDGFKDALGVETYISEDECYNFFEDVCTINEVQDMAMKILVVDDEKLLVKGIKFNLENEGYTVEACYDGEAAVSMAKSGNYDLIILDLMMPKKDGLEACQEIRSFSTVPIIMLTARSEDNDKLLGFEYGADDYITKPFNPLELMARVKSHMRRYTALGSIAEKSNIIRIGGIELDKDAKQVRVEGEPIKMTATEYGILQLLMENAGKVFSIDEIYEKVWNEQSFAPENTVSVHIRRIREKIEINPKEPRYLKVVWGIGYKIEKI